jgi:ABC-2 type transport system permease protein
MINLNEVNICLTMLRYNLLNSYALGASFFLSLVGMILNNSSFILIWVFFNNALGGINGWSTSEVILAQGFGSFAFGIVHCIFGGINEIPRYIQLGTLDRFFLLPNSVLYSIAFSKISVSAIGDIAHGLICVAIYLIANSFDYVSVLFIITILLTSTMLFFSFNLISSSICFIFVAGGDSLARSVYEVFIAPSIFHGGIFTGFLRFLFIFLIPSLVVSALPIEALRTLELSKLALIFAFAVAWLIIAVSIFNRLIKRYESSNLVGLS